MELTFVKLSPRSDNGVAIVDQIGQKVLLVGESNNHPNLGDAILVSGNGNMAVIGKVDDQDLGWNVVSKIAEVQVEVKYMLPTDDGGVLSLDKINLDVISEVAPMRYNAVVTAMLEAISILNLGVTNMEALESAVQTSVDNWLANHGN